MTDPDLERRLNVLEKKHEALKDEMRRKEMAQLRWGLYALGAVVLAMGGWIWAQVDHLINLKIGK